MRQHSEIETLLIKYRPMIRSKAHEVSRIFHVEYEEMEAQGLLIFTRAYRDWDRTRASFSTYLWRALDALRDYAKGLYRRGACEDVYQWEDGAASPEDFQRISADTIENFMAHLAWAETQCLFSEDAQALYQFIIGMEWYNPEAPCRLTLIGLQGWFRLQQDWSKSRLQRAWSELRRAWNPPIIGLSVAVS